MTHPLTDDLAKKVAINALWSSDIGEVVFTHNDLRAAADWQLEQVLKWLNETILERGCSFEAVNIPEELEEAMRPQEDNND